MQFLAHLFVGQPLRIALVGIAFLAAHVVRRRAAAPGGRVTQALLVAAVLWLLYALWEWLVLTRSPEANIRVDLLLIWPLLAVVSGWAIYRAVR